ncbi:hypothetical protein P153DRAFT_405361 [Dothidotthia symphoricarpi CBS 119687]|uniref:Protein kinase domain-containing protein n=1 Tax=Dothidotthia symphoricarpi CBS 119687 TaxID=1392245 RepID=A0A6A6AAA2_9PLEO|nr:uncharacterized protein P153DRAFT_405361 [Dothidotthia symphoricarpi CBS 119687]KAF2128095.1 hypothetical protein P153DRAFT_405361 [Dothidotthia symphoricarpi CBS 119687]
MSQLPFVDWHSTGFATKEQFNMIVLRGLVKLYINVEVAQVKGTHFGEEYLQKINLDRGGRYDMMDSIPNLVYQYCLPLIERLAPQTSLQDLSLEYFLHTPAYNLNLVDAGNEDIRIEGGEECMYTPCFSISPMRTADLPELCKAIPRFRACETWIARPRDMGHSLDSSQGRVMTVDGIFMFFKPRLEMREPDFERELQILLRINEAGLTAQIRVPRLEGIVISGENGETTIGMLMTLIISPKIGMHLKSEGFWGKFELHKKWEEQVIAIVQELHANGIVWGDVNPMNVVIDEAMDAWVIDFGGMNNIEFVDNRNRETVEGDEQGITRLFQEWLPSRLSRHEKV